MDSRHRNLRFSFLLLIKVVKMKVIIIFDENSYIKVAGNMYNHSMPNYERILKEGFNGYEQRILKIKDRDFREGFREGQAIARELGLYMQKYCGCIYSEEDRYRKQIEREKTLEK